MPVVFNSRALRNRLCIKHQANSAADEKWEFKPNHTLLNKARPLHQVYVYSSFFPPKCRRADTICHSHQDSPNTISWSGLSLFPSAYRRSNNLRNCTTKVLRFHFQNMQNDHFLKWWLIFFKTARYKIILIKNWIKCWLGTIHESWTC